MYMQVNVRCGSSQRDILLCRVSRSLIEPYGQTFTKHTKTSWNLEQISHSVSDQKKKCILVLRQNFGSKQVGRTPTHFSKVTDKKQREIFFLTFYLKNVYFGGQKVDMLLVSWYENYEVHALLLCPVTCKNLISSTFGAIQC